ncbi:MAG: HAMP domain-containing sensor histidine kinase [Phormidesmis sp.]
MSKQATSVIADRCDLTYRHGTQQVLGRFEQVFRLMDGLLSGAHSSQSFSQSQVSHALEDTEVGVVFVSLAGRVTYCNKKFLALWQVPPGILCAQKYSQCIAYYRTQLKEPDAFCDDIEQLNEQPYAAGMTTLELKDGRVFEQCFRPQSLEQQLIGRVWGYAEIGAAPMALSAPEAEAVLQQDTVALLRKKNLYLQQQITKERALTQLRLRLSAQVVHRALSSLNFVSMTSDALEIYYDRWTETQRKNYLVQIRTAFKWLHQLINTLSDVCQLGTSQPDSPFRMANGSKADDSTVDALATNDRNTGELLSEPAFVDVYKVCCDLVEDFKRMYREHAFVSLNAADRAVAQVDESLLRTILTSLLENASKYSSNGLVKLVFSRRESNITLQVQDTGIGVPPSECDQLFDPFYRASNVGDIAGLGLGLTIAKASSDVLDGQIKLVSQAGSGTVVTVVLPVP